MKIPTKKPKIDGYICTKLNSEKTKWDLDICIMYPSMLGFFFISKLVHSAKIESLIFFHPQGGSPNQSLFLRYEIEKGLNAV